MISIYGRKLFVGVIALACSAMLVVSWIRANSWVAADPRNESRFFRSYDPVPFFQAFRCSTGFGTGSGFSSSAGSRFFGAVTNVRFSRTVEPDLCVKDQTSSILTGLNQNVLAALGGSDCEVSSDRVSLEEGIRVYYRCGTRTTGLVLATPPKDRPGPGERYGGSQLTLRIDEQWAVVERLNGKPQITIRSTSPSERSSPRRS
jgi:hypothetical protein